MDAEGKMYRQDMAEENGEIEPFPIDDVIDKVCEWNGCRGEDVQTGYGRGKR